METSRQPNSFPEFERLIQGHRSIRAYKPEAVPAEKLQRVLSSAQRASSSGNMQAYSIIVTSDDGVKRELHGPHFEQSMVLDAPLFLTFCADFRRMRRWLALREAPDNFDNFMSFMIGAIDAILASQNAALAAEAQDLGICYLGTTLASCERIAQILQCPPGVVPVVGFSLGVPAEAPASRDRLPLKALVHQERYQDPTDREVLEAYEERETRGWERYMSDPDLAQKVRDLGAENLAQVYTRVKYTQESHEIFSASVLRTLRRQGFLHS